MGVAFGVLEHKWINIEAVAYTYICIIAMVVGTANKFVEFESVADFLNQPDHSF